MLARPRCTARIDPISTLEKADGFARAIHMRVDVYMVREHVGTDGDAEMNTGQLLSKHRRYVPWLYIICGRGLDARSGGNDKRRYGW